MQLVIFRRATTLFLTGYNKHHWSNSPSNLHLFSRASVLPGRRRVVEGHNPAKPNPRTESHAGEPDTCTFAFCCFTKNLISTP